MLKRPTNCLYLQNHEESFTLRKSIADVSNSLAQYRLLAKSTAPNSIDANFACHLKEVEAQMQRREDAANAD